MKQLFSTSLATGEVMVNPLHYTSLIQLCQQISNVIFVNSEKTSRKLLLNHWSYRLPSDQVAHALEFGNDFNDNTYNLTFTEVGFIQINAFSFYSTEGEIYVYDAVDVNGFIHFLKSYMERRNIMFEISFLNQCNLLSGIDSYL